MCDGGCADAAFCSDDRNDPANGFRFRCREQAADRAHHVKRIDRRKYVIADATAHQFAIKPDVIDAADNYNAGSGVADRCELIEPDQNLIAAFGFQDDHVGGGRRAIGFGCRGHSTHLNFQMSLAEATIFARRLHGGCGFHGFAKRLHRYTRRRRNMIFQRRRDLRLLFGILARVTDHLPASLSLALSASE